MAYYNRVRNQKGEINKQRLRKRVERERERKRLIGIKQHAKQFNIFKRLINVS